MRLVPIALTLALLAGAVAIAQPQSGGTPAKAPSTSPKTTVHLPAQLKWADAPAALPKGAQVAVLEGDFAKEGPLVFRLRLPDGLRVPAHHTAAAVGITVLSGTLMLEGDGKDVGATLPAGSYAHFPAAAPRTLTAKGESILQFHGTGPWSITYANAADDPRAAAPAAAGMVTDQVLEAACASCIFEMPGVEGCVLAVKVGGKPYLVTGADHVNAHSLCGASKKATVSGEVTGDKFVATRFDMHP
jgi:hypothetical protein